MTKHIKNFILLFLTLFLTAQSSFGYVLTSNELNQILKNKFQQEVQRKLNLKPNDAEIKISVSNIPFNSIQIQTSKPKIEIMQISILQPSTYRRVTIKNPDNTVVKIFNVNVQTSVLREVLVASENIPFNKEITPKNTKLQKADILRNYDKVFLNYENNLIAKRNYQKGSVILAEYIKPKAEIAKNSIVDIVFLSKGIKIKLQGRALKDGNIGDTILVRSDKYNKIYSAKVNSSNEVVVKI